MITKDSSNIYTERQNMLNTFTICSSSSTHNLFKAEVPQVQHYIQAIPFKNKINTTLI